MVVGLHQLEQPLRLEVGDDPAPGFFYVEPGIRPAGLGDASVGPDRLHRRQIVVTPDVEVGEVVRRRDLEGARTELGVDTLVGDHGQLALEQRQDRRAAHGVEVPRIAWVHRHRRVAEHGLGTGRGDRERAAVRQRVADMVEVARHLPVGHLEVADRRTAARAPVDQVVVLVDVALLVQRDEHAVHGAHVAVVEGEPLALVVAGTAEPLLLLDDRAAVLLAPRPHAAHELLAAEVFLAEALGGERLLDHVLRGDAGVVGARQPAGVLAEHAMVAREHVLHGVVEGVAHVQGGRDVGRRDDDRVRLARRVGLGMKEARCKPGRRPLGLHGGRLEARRLLQVALLVAHALTIRRREPQVYALALR